MKKNIWWIILLLVAFLLGIYREVLVQKDNQKRVDIQSITKSGAKAFNVDVFLNASFVGGKIANYKKDNQRSFYCIFGDDVQYIVYMENSLAININEYLLANPNETKRIIGVTKEIPTSLEAYGKDFVKQWLDNNHEHESGDEHNHVITSEDFYQYFGYVYLDATVNLYNQYIVLNILIYLFGGIAGLGLLRKIYLKII